MECLTLIRPVLVKVKVTENYKKTATAELQEAVHRIDMELQRLAYQEKRLMADLEKKNPSGAPAVRDQVQNERFRLEENRRKLFDRLKEIGALALGAEVIYGKMESPVEVRVGDLWKHVLNTEIILQDGIITEIRQSSV